MALLPKDRNPKAAAAPTTKAPCGCGQATAAPREPKLSTPRPSCLECAEKHLGAAWAIYSEHADGYPYRALLVGHLHEAAEESRQWPDLAAALRAARTAFQRHGDTPDFMGLVGQLAALVGGNSVAAPAAAAKSAQSSVISLPTDH